SRVSPGEHRSRPGTLHITTALEGLDEMMPEDRSFTLDGGRFVREAMKRVHVDDPRNYVHTANFGSIGLGMGSAIGAYFGAPSRPSLWVVGDGGVMLGGRAEFNTAARHRADVIVAVVNAGAYGAEHIQFRRRELDPEITTFHWPDF